MSDEYDDEQARWWDEEAERKDALAVAARELKVMVHVPSQEDVTRAYLDRAMAGVTNAFCPTGKGGGQDNSCSSSGGHAPGDMVKWTFGGKTTSGWMVHQIRDDGFVVITKKGYHKVATMANLSPNEEKKIEKAPAPTVKTPPKTEDLIGPKDTFIDDKKFFGGWDTSVQPSDSVGRRLESGQGEPTRLKIKDLISTQEYTGADKVKDLAKVFDPKKASVQVFKKNGKHYIFDGHHTAAAALLAGHDSIRTKVIIVNEVTENAFCPTGPGGGQDNSCPPRKMGTTWPGFSPSGHPTETLEFAEWFSGSKVVDEHGAPKDTAPIRGMRDGYGGEPIVVYHGSPRGEFHEFRKDMMADADHLHFGPGFYFTEDVVAAEQFAKGGHSAQATGTNPTTMSYYLKSTKPFDVDKDSIDPSKLPTRERDIARSLIVQKTYAEEGRSEAVQKGKEFDKGEVRIPYRSLTSDRGVGGFGLDKHAVKDYLVSQGHDSLTTLMHDQGSPGKNRYWIIFEPDQVKSTRNKGNFTIGDPNVLNKDQLLERIGQLIDNRREFFAECPRDEKGHCLPEGSSKVVDPGELAKARQIAERKAAEARKPTKEEKEHAQKKLEEMGANKYRRNIVGNTSDRRKRREALLKEFGDGKTCPCVYCGLKVKEGTLEQDKIYTTAQGGKYRVDNVIPSCSSCNKKRGDTPWKDVKW